MTYKSEKQEKKKGVVESVTPYMVDGVHQQDKYKNFRHTVKFKGDDAGYSISTKDDGAKAWTIGKEVEFEPTKWTEEGGSKSFMAASIVRDDNPYRGRGGAPQPKGQKEYKTELLIVNMTNAANVIAMRSDLNESDFKKYLKSFVSASEAELKAIWGDA
jgi:hypothetical protein